MNDNSDTRCDMERLANPRQDTRTNKVNIFETLKDQDKTVIIHSDGSFHIKESKQAAKKYWCNTHQRFALNSQDCDSKLGGIMMSCSIVNLEGIATIE